MWLVCRPHWVGEVMGDESGEAYWQNCVRGLVFQKELTLFLGGNDEICNQEGDRGFFRKITLSSIQHSDQPHFPEIHSFLSLQNTVFTCFSSCPLNSFSVLCQQQIRWSRRMEGSTLAFPIFLEIDVPPQLQSAAFAEASRCLSSPNPLC